MKSYIPLIAGKDERKGTRPTSKRCNHNITGFDNATCYQLFYAVGWSTFY
jgi:hypothetical protein